MTSRFQLVMASSWFLGLVRVFSMTSSEGLVMAGVLSTWRPAKAQSEPMQGSIDFNFEKATVFLGGLRYA